MILSTVNIDQTSRSILRRLAADGRASYQALADDVGLSRPAVMERVKKLEEQGYIEGYAARLDRARLGRPITAFVAIRFPVSDGVSDVAAMLALRDHPDVLEVHHVAGEDCFVMKVAAPSLERLERVLRALKEKGQGITTRTTIVLSTVFEKPNLLPEEAAAHG